MPQSTTSLTIPSQLEPPPAEVFGALREGLHLAGYSFERAVKKLDYLLADDRWKQCGEFDGDVNKFLACISLADFKPTIDKRKSIAKKLKKIEASQRAIAKVIGVGVATVSRDLNPATVPSGTPPPKNPNETKAPDPPSVPSGTPAPPSPDSGIVAATRLAKKETRATREDQAAARRAKRDEVPAADSVRLYNLPVADLAQEIEPGSVDLVFTDPPYERAALNVYRELAVFAHHALKPGGSLVVLCGQTWLPDALKQLCSEDLSYQWMLSYQMPGGSVMNNSRSVHVGWKPVVWMVKGKYEGVWVDDQVRTPSLRKQEVDLHKWQQQEEGSFQLLKKFCSSGQAVCDPLMGSGTYGVAALRRGCSFIGSDIDAEALEIARGRFNG